MLLVSFVLTAVLRRFVIDRLQMISHVFNYFMYTHYVFHSSSSIPFNTYNIYFLFCFRSHLFVFLCRSLCVFFFADVLSF